MEKNRFPLVLIPKFSTYVGAGAFTSVALRTTLFEQAVVHVWRGVLRGTSPTISVSFEESSDGEAWSVCSGGTAFTPAQETETTKELELDKQYFRIKVTLGGTDVAVTLYALGHLDAREQNETPVPEEPTLEVSP